MKPPTSIAWENGPTGGASSGEVIAVLLMANSFRYWVGWSGWWSPRLRALPMPCGRGPFPHHSTLPCPRNSRFPQRHNWIHLGRSPSRNVASGRSEEHTSELQSPCNLVCRLLLEKKKRQTIINVNSTPASPHDQP